MTTICAYMQKYCHDMVDNRWIETLKLYAESVAVNYKTLLVRDAEVLRQRFPVLLEFLFWRIRDPSGIKGIAVTLSLCLSVSLPSIVFDLAGCLIVCVVISNVI